MWKTATVNMQGPKYNYNVNVKNDYGEYAKFKVRPYH